MKNRRTVLLIVVGLGVVALGAWLWLRRDSAPPDDDADPRLTFATPYRNTRPGVKYVGDATCADCHARIAAAYREHPMSRSLARVAEMRPIERYGADARNPFERLGIHFEVERRGDRMIHRETQHDAAGQVAARLESEVHFAVGSGTRGRTYLLERDGYLFQAPISWYSSDKGRWDLTPGLQVAEHFERPAQAKCLFCHCNEVEPVPDTVNRYRAPLFRGFGIGCERCHGPGELHVAARERGDPPTPLLPGEKGRGGDDTIVNPSRLSRVLRDAVCEQCHLQGESRVLRRGRELFDYRPGLPLDLFVSTFVRRAEFADGPLVGGHAEQMRASRCYEASAGRLGCISCHDPHSVPAVGARVKHYRDRCLQCHTDKSCALPFAERSRQNPADSCIDCHMRPAKSRIAHTAIADHRILRRPNPTDATPAPRALRPGEVPLLHFHRAAGALDAETSRDLGLALSEVAMKYPAMGRVLGPTALPLLEAAVKNRPDDVAAWEAKGFVLWQLDRKPEALAALETTLAKAPKREVALTYAAVLAPLLGRNDEALAYWRRAIDVNPWSSLYHARLAKLLAERDEWDAALKECELALRLNPFHEETKTLRETCRRKSSPAAPHGPSNGP